MSRHGERTRRRGLALGVLFAALPLVAAAQDQISLPVAVHFSGGWAMGDTDGNSYLAGAEDRDYDERDLSVTFFSHPHEKLRLSAQLSASNDPVESDEIQLEVNFAFAEWAFSDLAKLRAGVVRHPFGLYSETIETGTVRPFYALPSGVYARATFLSPGYQGFGLSGYRAVGSWELEYDLYAGELTLDSPVSANPLYGVLFPGGAAVERQNVRDLVGGRFRLGTPIDGLRFSIGAYQGSPETGEEGDFPDHEAYIGSVEWLRGNFEIRAEAAHRSGGSNQAEVDAWYLEAAYRLTEHWQVAGRFDTLSVTADTVLPPPVAGLFEHEDRAVGVNWWPSPNLVFKLSFHQVTGNAFAVPEELPNLALGEGLDERTNLVQLGVQFAY